jgi:NMD protein affecting ribosome stability and mRNA decay
VIYITIICGKCGKEISATERALCKCICGNTWNNPTGKSFRKQMIDYYNNNEDDDI